MTPARNPSDIVWILLCAALALMMQVRFCCLESGLVRSKNSINLAIKNFADLCVSSALYWLVGFAVMFGVTYTGLPGISGFLFDDEGNSWLTSFFLFQILFFGTAATIISSAVAERMKFVSYLIVTAVVSAVIYPFFGHWAWGGFASRSSGWSPGRPK